VLEKWAKSYRKTFNDAFKGNSRRMLRSSGAIKILSAGKSHFCISGGAYKKPNKYLNDVYLRVETQNYKSTNIFSILTI